MTTLPKDFVERMKRELDPSEWDGFFSALQEGTPYRGIRVNTLKISRERFEEIFPFPLGEPLSWEESGYYFTEEKIGGHPYAFAGLFYSQEPSAQSVVPKLGIRPNDKVLDLCAAPGGKSTQIAACLKQSGLLVSNEFVFARAKILSENIERAGIKNALVFSERPKRIAEKFPAYFDKVLVDAPCSGEGMFRKNREEELKAWSEENVLLCRARQEEILSEAQKCLKVGGKLAYSTCTFSKSEDEECVRWFLERYPQMKLLSMEKLFPHRVKGEGHFSAVFEKTDGEDSFVPIKRTKISPVAEKEFRAFEKETLHITFDNLFEAGGLLYALPSGAPDWGDLSIVRGGVRLGEVSKTFLPSHSLAMALKKEECKNVLDLTLSDKRTEKFLRGETIEADGIKKGWCLVTVDGYPIGWGKYVDGTVKNHIPKGLRIMN